MNRKEIIFGVFVFLFLGVLFQSCSKEEEATPSIKYASDIAPIMNDYCITCHSGAAPEAGLTLDNYAGVKAIGESGKLFNRTNDTTNPMPPSGLMPEAKRQKIEDWIDGGFEE